MKTKLTCFFVVLASGVFLFAGQAGWCHERFVPTRITQDQIPAFFPPEAPGPLSFCVIQHDDGSPAYFFDGIASSQAYAVYMDPAECPTPPAYPFKVTDAHFYLYRADTATHSWPVSIQVNVRAVSQGDECLGPDLGTPLCSESFDFPPDSSYDSLGRAVNFSFSQLCCVNEPFFMEVKYLASPQPGKYHPSPLMDDSVALGDTCNFWFKDNGSYSEWTSVFGFEVGGPMIRATGYTDDPECGDTCWYWKADKPGQWPAYAPSGMPDFDQYQFGIDSSTLDGPTAVANCLWWYNAIPGPMDPPELIRLLSDYFKCDPAGGGTEVDSMQFGLDQYFIDYGFPLYEHTYYQPDFEEMEDSLKKSQDIILLLGIWQVLVKQWERIGQRYVTMAGVCSESLKVAISDPGLDWAVWEGWPGRIRPPGHPEFYPPTLHNDPTFVSQDIWECNMESPSPGNPNWSLIDYPWAIRKGEAADFSSQEYFADPLGRAFDVYAEVEAAIMICPGDWYWKPDTTIAPSGMPDFDQNQDDWDSYCGPAAVANCLWWFDAVPFGTTPPELIELLAKYFGTGPAGTDVTDMQNGLEEYFEYYGFALQESTFFQPDFYEMEDSLKRCQDIILLLGFWFWDGMEWLRYGGHFVTMAGVHSEALKVAFSDPDRDGAVFGQRGRVRPPAHPTGHYEPTLHNDPNYVSQDVYDCTIVPDFPSPGNPNWEIDDYFEMIREEYAGKNVPEIFEAQSEPLTEAPPPPEEMWRTEVEYAVMICPKPVSVEEEEGPSVPRDFQLEQNYPNPFNNGTVIEFNLRRPAEVSLAIYNILGQRVRTLVDGRSNAGSQTVSWDGKDNEGNDLSSGIYFYQLKTDQMTETKRLVLLK